MDAKVICAGSSEPEYFYILPEKWLNIQAGTFDAV
jgi:hypothetical protein